MSAITVREAIIQAFSAPPQPFPGHISVPTYDDEGTTEYFSGKSWQGHPAIELRHRSSSLSFFTVEAFRYYLPAYMLAELDEPQVADVIAEGILFHFTKDDRRCERLDALNEAERRAVAGFFEECALRYGEMFHAAALVLRVVKP